MESPPSATPACRECRHPLPAERLLLCEGCLSPSDLRRWERDTPPPRARVCRVDTQPAPPGAGIEVDYGPHYGPLNPHGPLDFESVPSLPGIRVPDNWIPRPSIPMWEQPGGGKLRWDVPGFLTISEPGECFACGRYCRIRWFLCRTPGHPRVPIIVGGGRAPALADSHLDDDAYLVDSVAAAEIADAFVPSKRGRVLEAARRPFCSRCMAVAGHERRRLRADREQEVIRRAFMGFHSIGTISTAVARRPDTVERKLRLERRLRKQICAGIAAELLARGYKQEQVSSWTGLSVRTLGRLGASSQAPLTLPRLYPEHLEVYAATMGADPGYYATLLYVAHWATSGGIFGSNAPTSRRAESEVIDVTAAEMIMSRIDEAEARLAEGLNSVQWSLAALAGRFPEIEDDVDLVRQRVFGDTENTASE